MPDWRDIVHSNEPETAFHGLPLSAEQEAEIQHYIHQRKRRGLAPDAAELSAMLKDMLHPPGDDDTHETGAEGPHTDAERAANRIDSGGDPIAAREERNAASEAEFMKHQGTQGHRNE